MNEKKWTDDERDEAFDRGMETMQRVALELYRRGREPLLEELEAVKRERDQARDKYEALAVLVDGYRRERDEAREEAASSLGMAKIADVKHGWKCAEVDMLRGVGCMEDGDGPCGVCRKCAYRRGAEAMREACARWMSEREGISQWVYDDALSALPIPEEP